MKIFAWMNAGFGLLAIGFGAIVLRGILKRSLSRKWLVKFLRWSLLASVAGLLPPVRHLAPIQQVCMLSVYCAGGAILAWLHFRLVGIWRQVFTFLITTVLYLNAVSVSIGIFNHFPLLTAASIAFSPCFEITQACLAVAFAALSILVVRSCHTDRPGYHKSGTGSLPCRQA